MVSSQNFGLQIGEEVMSSEIVAVVCSDFHLSDKPPRARAQESDWFEAQGRVFDQIRQAAKVNGTRRVLFAGDLFDKPKVSPRLEEFAIRQLRSLNWIAIPGQHDLVGHNLDLISQSSFGVVLAARAVRMAESGDPIDLNNGITVYGFPWGVEPDVHPDIPRKRDENESLRIGLVHKTMWYKEEPFPGAPPDGNAERWLKSQDRLMDVYIVGDNHQQFQCKKNGRLLFNCGGMLRRGVDDIDAAPRIGLLRSDGVILDYRLDTSSDVFVVPDNQRQENKERKEGLDAFINVLSERQSGKRELSFGHALDVVMNERQTSKQARQRIEEIRKNG